MTARDLSDERLLAALAAMHDATDPMPDGLAERAKAALANRNATIAAALHEYADRLDAVPLDCTALTGPVWYGQGWRDAVNHLRDLADGLMPAPSAVDGSRP